MITVADQTIQERSGNFILLYRLCLVTDPFFIPPVSMRKTPLTSVNNFGTSSRSSRNARLELPSSAIDAQKERKAIHRLNATGLRSVIKLLFGHKTGFQCPSHLKRRTVAMKWLRDRKHELQQQFAESDADSDVEESDVEESDVEETDSIQSVSSVEET